jgi:hypothetical protein
VATPLPWGFLLTLEASGGVICVGHALWAGTTLMKSTYIFCNCSVSQLLSDLIWRMEYSTSGSVLTRKSPCQITLPSGEKVENWMSRGPLIPHPPFFFCYFSHATNCYNRYLGSHGVLWGKRTEERQMDN